MERSVCQKHCCEAPLISCTHLSFSYRQEPGHFQPQVKPDVNTLFWSKKSFSRQNAVFVLTLHLMNIWMWVFLVSGRKAVFPSVLSLLSACAQKTLGSPTCTTDHWKSILWAQKNRYFLSLIFFPSIVPYHCRLVSNLWFSHCGELSSTVILETDATRMN